MYVHRCRPEGIFGANATLTPRHSVCAARRSCYRGADAIQTPHKRCADATPILCQRHTSVSRTPHKHTLPPGNLARVRFVGKEMRNTGNGRTQITSPPALYTLHNSPPSQADFGRQTLGSRVWKVGFLWERCNVTLAHMAVHQQSHPTPRSTVEPFKPLSSVTIYSEMQTSHYGHLYIL